MVIGPMNRVATKREIRHALPGNLRARMVSALIIIWCVTKWQIVRTNPMNRCTVMWTNVPRWKSINAVISVWTPLPVTTVIVIRVISKSLVFVVCLLVIAHTSTMLLQASY